MSSQTLLALACLVTVPATAQTIGIFESQTDIGTLLHPGSAEFEPASQTYGVTSSGENMWAGEDDFHFVWKKVTGGVTITAAIAFPAATGNAHKKGALMIRRTLDSDSDYVDAALHLSGLTSLQARGRKGDITREMQSYIASPKRLRLVKSGNSIFMYVAGEDGVFHLSGGSMEMQLHDPYYVGIAACAHDKDALEKVEFSNVDITSLAPTSGKPILYSTLEAQTSDRRAVWVAPGRFEAPHWSKDGKTIFFTRDGRLARIPAAGGVGPETVDTGNLTHIDAHTGLSPGGPTVAVTDSAQIYTVPTAGGTPQLIANQPSYFCDWSPDGKTILFIGTRNGERQLLTVPATGGEETAIPTEHRIENPVWSPDGQYIYYDMVRSMIQIWRMLPDGSHPEQVTTDNFVNSTPELSPEGRQMAFMSVDRNDQMVRIMNLDTRATRIMAVFHNYDGVLGASPWSPDSKFISSVSYQHAPF